MVWPGGTRSVWSTPISQLYSRERKDKMDGTSLMSAERQNIRNDSLVGIRQGGTYNTILRLSRYIALQTPFP